MSKFNNINNNHVGLYNSLYQPENFTFDNVNAPIHMPINSQAQSYAQSFRPYVTTFPFHGNVDVNTINYNNAGNTTSYQNDPPVSYYHPDVNTMNRQLNTSNNKQDINSSCPLCGSSNGHLSTINSRSATYTFMPMRTQPSLSFVMDEPTSTEYMVIREMRIQSVLGRVPAAASIEEMLALTRM